MTQGTFTAQEPIQGREPARGAGSQHDAMAVEGSSPAGVPAEAWLTISLGSGETLQVFYDRVLAGRYEFPYDDWFGARLVPDPRAPLTVRPALAVALISHGAAWHIFVPSAEHDAVRVLAAIREACRRCGIEPIGIDDPVQLPQMPQPAQQPPSLYFPWQEPDQQPPSNKQSWLRALVHTLAHALHTVEIPRAE